MPEVNSPVPGHFCWIELATSDPSAAKKFYAGVFGWGVNENDMGEIGVYTIFRKNDRDVAAMYGLMPEQKAQGVPSNWLTYIGVESADDIAAKAQSLGATLLQPPFDVFDFGRMAVLQDPQGAVFALWEAKTHCGVTIRDEANTLCWNELATNDAGASRSFYTALIGWEAKVSPEYTEWYLDGKPLGGMRTINEGEPTPPNWMPYFMVDDVDATTNSVLAGGGTAHVPPRDMMSVGRFSVVGDPQGAVFALFKPAEQA
ncbi:MAG TPA: VOC family protein [Thermoanaerobaculia bacterium]|nr:VOC family protein [Thermoanaerobaculia bacterium]